MARAAPAELIDDPRLTAVGLLFEAAAGLQAHLAAQAAQHDLAISELDVLLRLTRSPGGQLRMSDLAAQVDLSSSGLTRLVERRACPTDGRGAFATATEAGVAVLLEVLPGHIALIEHWYTSHLTPAGLDALSGALRTVRDAVRPDAEAGAHRPARPPSALA